MVFAWKKAHRFEASMWLASALVCEPLPRVSANARTSARTAMKRATFLLEGSTCTWASDISAPPVARRLNSSSAPHARRLDRQPLSAPGEEELEVEIFPRTVGQHLGAYPRQAGAQAAFERAHRLPLHTIRRVGVGMALADGLGEQPLAPLRVVTVSARQVHLSAAQMVGDAARIEMRSRRAVDARRDRSPKRLAREVGGEREQLLGLVAQS